jgi:drug/metabolite transporter (DMT)-like permease
LIQNSPVPVVCCCATAAVAAKVSATRVDAAIVFMALPSDGSLLNELKGVVSGSTVVSTVLGCLRYHGCMNRVAIYYALASAALFGLSTPAAKVLLGSIHPAVLAGLLYCGAGLGVAMLRRIRPEPSADRGSHEAALTRRDAPWLAAAIFFGGIVGPILLMIGLTRTEASTASLLLTLEGAATALLAWFLFHESFDRRIVLGMLCLLAGAAILSWSGTPTFDNLLGPLAIAGACFAWGLDNNLTRKVSLSDPLQIVQIKGLVAGPINLLLGLWAGGSFPPLSGVALSACVGFVGYGLSLVLFVYALRHLGAARTGAYFSTAPFFGATAAVLALNEAVTASLLTAAALMGVGVWLHLTERHEHLHVHATMTHTHSHSHDVHHRHEHATSDPSGEPHTHAHVHSSIRHEHAHTPDMHHAHRHE